jgi:hypothetical protein
VEVVNAFDSRILARAMGDSWRKAVREKRDGPSALPTSAKFGQIWGTRRVIGRLTEEQLAKRRTARCAALGIGSCMAGLLLENRKSLPGWAGSFLFASIPKNFLL